VGWYRDGLEFVWFVDLNSIRRAERRDTSTMRVARILEGVNMFGKKCVQRNWLMVKVWIVDLRYFQ